MGMRRGAMNADTLFDDDGNLIAINMGADYCAEHEWGIKRLYEYLGIDNELRRGNVGLARRSPKATPEIESGLYRLDQEVQQEKLPPGRKRRSKRKEQWKTLAFVKTRYSATREEVQNWLQDNKELEFYDFGRSAEEESLMVAAWNEDSFAIRVRKDERFMKGLDDLHAALLTGDFAVWFGSANPENPFARSGLCIGIVSRLPEKLIQDMANADLDQLDLLDAEEASGINEVKNQLKKQDKGWFALSPRFFEKEDGTTILKWWLNPMKQDKYDHGWYTIQELRDWVDEKGPIIK